MENTADRGLNFSLGLALSIALLVIIITAVTIVLTLGNNQTNKLSSKADEVDKSTYTSWDGQYGITGITVQSLAKQWSTGDVYVSIKRSSGSEIVMYYNKDFNKPIDDKINREIASGLTNKKSQYYVNPSAKFECAVAYDNNGVLTGVEFTQQ